MHCQLIRHMQSIMNNVIRIFNRLLVDVSKLQKVHLSAPRDIDMAWILIEGPRLDKILLKHLETEGVSFDPPEWLSPLWDLWITQRDPVVLKCLRQILGFGYKAVIEPTKTQENEAQASFLETEKSIVIFNEYFTHSKDNWFFSGARKLVSRIIAKLDFYSIEPSHGPGAVFPHFDPSEKSSFDTVYTSIDKYYGFFDYFRSTSSQIVNALRIQDTLSTADEIICRLTSVPKDSRGPRLISVHPREAIWIQQGIRSILEHAIESSPLTSKRINFSDQSVNGSLALRSSVDRAFCTIDLKDASDRISLELFRYLFGYSAQFFECCRASKIVLFDGSLHQLEKYAPMGNATAFPVESLIFWAVVQSGIQCRYGEICNDIYVFGDDIIVPTRYYEVAISSLVRAGLLPNTSKCFVRGFFRESCGIDAYKGVDITPHRIKRHTITSSTDLVSLCALAKNLRIDGFEETSSEIYSLVRKHLGLLHLSNNPEAQGVCEYVIRDFAYLLRNEGSIRWNRHLHRWETRLILTMPILDRLGRHDWYHVLDSMKRVSGSSIGGRISYPIPYRDQQSYGWTPVIMSS